MPSCSYLTFFFNTNSLFLIHISDIQWSYYSINLTQILRWGKIFFTHSTWSKLFNIYICLTLSPRGPGTPWIPFGPRFPYKKVHMCMDSCRSIYMHALFHKHLLLIEKTYKSQFFQRPHNPPSALLFPASLAPPWCHQTPKTKEGIEEDLIIAVAIASLVVTCYHHQISLTLDPGGPGGPVGPPSPSSPAGPRRPFNPCLPGGPGGPCRPTLKWFTGLLSKVMNNQEEGSNSPGLPWTLDHPSHPARL